jgi:hypothetical protein
MTPMQPDLPIMISLEAQQWNVVLGALGEAPWRISNPIIQRIVGQIEQSQGEPVPLEQRGNGIDEHAPH